jgi:hypothetical protein
MDSHLPDARIGQAFSEKIKNLLSVQVAYGEKGPSSAFFLLVSFSRFRFRLTVEAVQACLASILGGTSCNFSVLQLDEQVFCFRVSCKRVGFLVLQLVSFACDSFKLAFHLCNNAGFQAALAFSKSDSGPSFSWTEVRKKKFGHLSYAQVARSNRTPLSGANKTPLGNLGDSKLISSSNGANSQHFGSPGSSVPRFGTPLGLSREDHDISGRQAPRNNVSGPQQGTSGNHRPRLSVFNRISFPKRSVFDRLDFRSTQGNGFFQNLNPRSKGTVDQPVSMDGLYGTCKRCLSSNHPRAACKSRIKCWHCCQEGHILKDCPAFTASRKPVVIHGSEFTDCFSSYPKSAIWQNRGVDIWFKEPISLASGPADGGPPILNGFRKLGTVTWSLKEHLDPSHSQCTSSPQENPAPPPLSTIHPATPPTGFFAGL